MPEWSAAQYSKFKYERTLPAIDLADSIRGKNIKSALDIGCGIGNSTVVLAQRFPGAKITGADNSDDMLASAKKEHPGIEFIKLDASKELCALKDRYDLVFSNACIQWIPDHPALLKNMLALLNEGGILAVQTPLQSKHPVHKILRTLAESEKWKSRIASPRIFYNLSENEYFDVLSDLSSDFRIWETTYFHSMPSHESIVEWYKGTGLRPFLEQLSLQDQTSFLADVLENIKSAYPVQKNGEIIFRFPRLFFIAEK